MPIPLRALLLCLTFFTLRASAESKAPAHPILTVSGHQFLLGGKPYQIISGEMHYPRIPRPYWRDRLRKARAMGLNTITTYVFWNLHEPQPGHFDFSGQNDLGEFIREAQAEGLNVILRPGPYICAEWELGGYPSWLLKDRSLQLRSENPAYLAAIHAWFTRLGQEIRPLLAKNGGPIIAVQVENEYGSFGDDVHYLEDIKQELMQAGMGDTLLYTANPPQGLRNGSLPDLPAVVNFGAGDAQKSFAALEQFRPDGPRMSGEYWAGWFDKWGEDHHVTDGQKEAAELRWMLDKGYSVNLYMFDGGTSFGWMNGADSHTGTDYHPDTTSYDYDAPIDEHGDPSYKFNLFRKAILDHTHTSITALPSKVRLKSFPISPEILSASLWRNLPTPKNSRAPLTFEDLDQSYGYVLYRTGLDEGQGGRLILEGLHDYAQIYIDQQLIGTLDRRLGQTTLDLPRVTHAATLDILVENTGRVNYSHAILTERAGLTGSVSLDGEEFRNWENFSLPMDDLSSLRFERERCSGPCFFKTNMEVTTPADTYIDTQALDKGQLWLGDHNLGRFWSIGPQYTLYAPGCWEQRGANRITIFDLDARRNEKLVSVTTPRFGATKHTRDVQ
ncbi:MAG TPA: beta-galactosidase family protein [Acidobacteriaceae bacterium]|nr:beta-galactosidase family protein [Acidobacteriaceae bacterium]